MDAFKKKFIEEALEHIEEIEKALLELESDLDNSGLIEKIFRAMHSLKGGGSMFGFDKISDFTHHMENIYDSIRIGEIKITKQILSLTLQSIDHLKLLINEDNEDEKLIAREHARMMKKIDSLQITPDSTDKSRMEDEGWDEGWDENLIDDGDINTYYIYFEPKENFFDNGSNPLLIFDELSALGQIISLAHLNKLPKFDKLNPTECHIYWEAILSTNADINSISDVFIFVEDNCQLEIHKISDFNLNTNKVFVRKINELFSIQTDIGIKTIQDLAALMHPSIAGKIRKTANDKTLSTTSLKESKISSIRVSSDKLDNLMNLVSELVTTQARLNLFSDQNDMPELTAISENVQKLSRQLRDIAFSIVLIPIENMITRFQRLVRDLSMDLKKDVVFVTEGTDTELDKTIIEGLTDPLMHIIRNSLDHGIESPEERIKLGKPKQGRIKFRSFYSGTSVHIEISDDGAGIDPFFIREKAVKKGIISNEMAFTDKEIIDLIFLPGFSTVQNVTDVSGRGVGMDVVKRKIAEIRGEVEVETEKGKGTTIIIKLPLTLSIIDGLLVEVEKSFYVVPLTAIDKIYALEHEQIMKRYNNIVVLDDEQIPYFYLRKEFGILENAPKFEHVLVLKYEDKRVGLIIDTVIGEYQAVLKPLGKYYKKQDIISGATILGDGTIALVLDTNKAIKNFAEKHKTVEEKL